MTTPERILIVDDEDNLRELVRSYLKAEGYEVSEASDGRSAVEAVRSHRPDLVILDVRMPGLDGFEALQEIRTFSDVHVIMLTARADEADKLIGLTVGADDYITKPFSPRELVARVKAVLRRIREGKRETDSSLEFAGLVIDPERRQLTVEGTRTELTALEFDLLVEMASQPGRVFSRRQLLESVWGWDYFGDERVVDVHIRNLRRALGDDASNPAYIGTVRGVGYRFLPEPA
ncbi:MAG: response regulator transcription factor [Actinomycetota bacterium]|nr:response regulator transcription factor [Actinomycetota bacterium]